MPIGVAVGSVLSLFFLWQGTTYVLSGGGDTGWLIRTGEYIAQNNRLPVHDLYTWTSADRPFICYQWLFELVLFALFKAGGLSAVGAVTFAVVSILYLYGLPRFWLEAGVKPWLIPLFMAPVLTPYWFFARPQIVSLVLALVFVAVLERWRQGRSSKLVFLLPPIVVVWTNLHCLAFIGPALIAAYLLDNILARKKEGPAVRQLWVVFFLSLAALFVLPLDFQSIAGALHTFASTDPQSWTEMQPLYVTKDVFSLCNFYVLVAPTILLLGRKKVPRCGLVISIVALASGLAVARMQPLGVLLSWPFVGMALSSGSAAILPIRQRMIWLLLALVAAQAMWFGRYANEESAVNAFLGRPGVLQFAAKHLGADDRIFNDTICGSRLIFLKGPPVFIDSRGASFDPQFYKDWLAAMKLTSPWASYSERFKIKGVVLSQGYPLYDVLMRSPQWRLCLDDGGTSLWLKNNETTEARMRQWGLADGNCENSGLSTDDMVTNKVAQAAKHIETAGTFIHEGKLIEARAEAQASNRLIKSNRAAALLIDLDQHLIK